MNKHFNVDVYSKNGFSWSEIRGISDLMLTGYRNGVSEIVSHSFYASSEFIEMLTKIREGYLAFEGRLISNIDEHVKISVLYIQGVFQFYDGLEDSPIVLDISDNPRGRAMAMVDIIVEHAVAVKAERVYQCNIPNFSCIIGEPDQGTEKKDQPIYMPFDIVTAKCSAGIEHTGIVTIVGGRGDASVEWFGDKVRGRLKNAWWDPSELTVVDNALKIITNKMAGNCTQNAETHFPRRYR